MIFRISFIYTKQYQYNKINKFYNLIKICINMCKSSNGQKHAKYNFVKAYTTNSDQKNFFYRLVKNLFIYNFGYNVIVSNIKK